MKVNEYLNGIKDKTISGMNTRYAWTKGMLYTFDFIEFAEKIAGTYEITDVWGQKRDIRDAEVILTESMLKLWSCYNSWEEYFENCEKNHYQFSCAKTTPEKLESVRFTNYQFLQSYEFTDEELKELCQPAIDEIKDVIGMDYRKSLAFLAGFGLNDDNVFKGDTETYVKALMVEPKLINDPFVRRKIYNMIRTRIEMGMRGAFLINANFAMISGDPYALAQSMFDLEVTGLLKVGEIYHKYWKNKKSSQVVCLRSPMTNHNNIRKMNISYNPNAEYWFRYIETAAILNAFDTTTDATNGSDFDGDQFFITDNPVLLKNTKNSTTIICLQKKAKKIVPTEDDIIEANKLAFNDDIGTITNRVTSMFEVQSIYDKENNVYKELEYRIMCGQHFQQGSIDRCKGIIVKPMPSYWYSTRGIDEYGFTEEEMDFQKKIMASHKPYFMTYVYPALRTENNKYIKNENYNAIRRFARYGIKSIQDLENYENKTDEMIQYLDYYYALSPVGNNPCIVNRIAWLFEREFKQYLTKLSKLEKDSDKESFDYGLLKSNSDYSKTNYDDVYRLYKEYNRLIKNYQTQAYIEKQDTFDNWLQIQTYLNWFKNQCYCVCSNEEELTDIVLDICYQNDNGKQFAWDMCGNIIINNLLKRNKNKITYPHYVDCGGEFTYFGNQFNMRTVTMKEVIDDNS